MSGTKAGGQAAAVTNKEKYGPDFYARIGAKGGKLGHSGGFNMTCDCFLFPEQHKKAQCAGVVGGRISRRGKPCES